MEGRQANTKSLDFLKRCRGLQILQMATNQKAEVPARSCRRKLSYCEISEQPIQQNLQALNPDEHPNFYAKSGECNSIYNSDVSGMLEPLKEASNFFGMTRGPSPPKIIHPVSEQLAVEMTTNTIIEDISYNTPPKRIKNTLRTTPQEKIAENQAQITATINIDPKQIENPVFEGGNDVGKSHHNQQPENSSSIQKAEECLMPNSPTKKRCRARIRDPTSWKQNVRKARRNEGKEYSTKKGKGKAAIKLQKPARAIKIVNCDKCHLTCTKNFSEEERQAIFNQYWGTKNYERQREFICKHVIRKDTKTKSNKKVLKISDSLDIQEKTSKRKYTFFYFLPKGSDAVRVCKKFFLGTLDVGESTVFSSKTKEINGSGVVINDQRGKHPNSRKIDESVLNFVRKHIESFPTMESHYCRKTSKRFYLDSELKNVSNLYRLYLERCDKDNIKDRVKKHIYRMIFNTEYNLSIHKPKKDLCKLCNKYDKSSVEEKLKLKPIYDKHQMNKNLARKAKEEDKEKTKTDTTFKNFTFDLESVLSAPCSNVSSMYYSRKLSSYNLTVYNQVTGDGDCYFWPEYEGKRGSDEIGSSIFHHLTLLPPETKNVVYYSDSCGGQNRNRFVATLLLYSVGTIQNLETIQLKFLETGHTQMEADSMHSCIESAKKNIPIYNPNDYHSIIRMARRKNPYNLHVLEHTDFFDLKKLKNTMIHGQLSSANWLKVKIIKVEKSKPNSIFVKTGWTSDDDYIEMDATPPSGKKKIRTQLNLVRKYPGPLAISSKKKKDLLSLCKDGVIPKEHHDFYNNLSSNDTISDKIPEPDIEEDEEDCDDLKEYD